MVMWFKVVSNSVVLLGKDTQLGTMMIGGAAVGWLSNG